MPEGQLFLGTRRYSSWSMRGWLAVRLAALDVEDMVMPLAGYGSDSTPAVRAVSPSAMVPCLMHQGVLVWDSLAIGEYCAEHAPQLWPTARADRAHARAIAAEMHSGFRDLRVAMPMNLGRDFSGRGRTPGALRDIARIEAIWAECLEAHGGPYLFGADFNLADAMYAPVCARFLSWRPELSPRSQGYVAAVRAQPLVAEWYALAATESTAWLLDKYENPA